MANEQNLIPLNKRAKSEQREIARKGGKKNGEMRREQKKLGETLKALLKLDYEVDKQVLDGAQAIGVALINQALNGNVKAYEVIRDTIGEKPISGVSLENAGGAEEIRISFVDKSMPGEEHDPKIIGEYTPPTETGAT